MALPPNLRSSYDPRRVFYLNLPKIELGPKTREIGTYISGGLVSLRDPRDSGQHVTPSNIDRGWRVVALTPRMLNLNFTSYSHFSQFAASFFLLIDAATLSSHAKPPPDAPYDEVPVHMTFVDWVPAIFSVCE